MMVNESMQMSLINILKKKKVSEDNQNKKRKNIFYISKVETKQHQGQRGQTVQPVAKSGPTLDLTKFY